MLGQDDHHQLSKGKRTKRPRPALTISTSGDESCRVATSSSTTTTTIINPTQEEEDMAHCLILLARGAAKYQKLTHTHQPESPAAVISVSAAAGGMCVYECKTCNRCFSSFQALGGHRASHKKPKSPVETAPAPSMAISSPEIQDCFRSTENCKTNKAEELGLSLQMACNSSNTLSASNIKNHQSDAVKSNKVHACAICGSEFSSGQALGGHMRRHRPISTSGGGSPAAQPAISPAPARNLLCLDLNLPAEEQEEQQQQQQQQQESSKFVFGSSGKTLVFAANSLVDCRY